MIRSSEYFFGDFGFDVDVEAELCFLCNRLFRLERVDVLRTEAVSRFFSFMLFGEDMVLYEGVVLVVLGTGR